MHIWHQLICESPVTRHHKMKIFIVAIFIIAAASMAKSDVQIMKAETTVKECADQIKVAPEIVAKIRAGDWSEHNTEAKVSATSFAVILHLQNALSTVGIEQMLFQQKWLYRSRRQLERGNID